jgi:hypothetical protein
MNAVLSPLIFPHFNQVKLIFNPCCYSLTMARPLGVTIVSLIYGAMGVIAAVGSLIWFYWYFSLKSAAEKAAQLALEHPSPVGSFGKQNDLSGAYITLALYLAIALLLIAILEIFISIKLFSGKKWARILGLFFALPMLLLFPFGTLFGVIIFVLLGTNQEVKTFFDQNGSPGAIGSGIPPQFKPQEQRQFAPKPPSTSEQYKPFKKMP